MKKLRVFKMKHAEPTKPLTEGEPYCPGCMCHIDSCGCLIVQHIPKVLKSLDVLLDIADKRREEETGNQPRK